MVTSIAIPYRFSLLLAQVEDRSALLEELDPPRNAILVMALLGIVLLGIVLVACIMIGGRWVRKLAESSPTQRGFKSAAQQAEWKRRLVTQLPKGISNETIIIDSASDETVHE